MQLDVRGLSCPEPVIQLKQVLAKNPATVTVLTDCATSKERLETYASSAGYQVEISSSGEDTILKLSK